MRATRETAQAARALLAIYDDILATTPGGPSEPFTDRLVENYTAMADVLREAFGKRPKPQPLQLKATRLDSRRSKMWMAMRIQREFTAQSIASAAECSVSSVRRLITALVECGYARCDHKSSFEVGDHSRFTLLRNTGPLVPREQSHGRSIYDPNLKQEVARARSH